MINYSNAISKKEKDPLEIKRPEVIKKEIYLNRPMSSYCKEIKSLQEREQKKVN